jgi:hypothetical protein
MEGTSSLVRSSDWYRVIRTLPHVTGGQDTHLLNEWATYGCPTRTGTPWTQEQMKAAVDRGPHRSALTDDVIAHFRAEVDKKVKSGQAKLVAWDFIKDNPPVELKISPIAAIPHKSKQFRSILDLSFNLRLKQGVLYRR